MATYGQPTAVKPSWFTGRSLLFLAILCGTWGVGWGVMAIPLPKASPDSVSTYDLSILAQPNARSGDKNYSGKLELFSQDDKEHVFDLGPSPVTNLSSNSSTINPGYSSATSPGMQSNMGFGISLPLFGSAEPDKPFVQTPAERMGDLGSRRVP